MLVYLAHPIGTYSSPAESTAIHTLLELGHQVINPHERQYVKACGHDMARWIELALTCDALALLPYADGAVGSGVRMELEAILAQGKSAMLLSPSGDFQEWIQDFPKDIRWLTMRQTIDRNRNLRQKPGWLPQAPNCPCPVDLKDSQFRRKPR